MKRPEIRVKFFLLSHGSLVGFIRMHDTCVYLWLSYTCFRITRNPYPYPKTTILLAISGVDLVPVWQFKAGLVCVVV